MSSDLGKPSREQPEHLRTIELVCAADVSKPTVEPDPIHDDQPTRPAAEANTRLIRGYAYHEVGHAIVQLLLNPAEDLISVSIFPDKDSGGRITVKPQHPVARQQAGIGFEGTVGHDKYICHSIMVDLAGEIVQSTFCHDTVEEYQSNRDRLSTNALLRQWDRRATRFELANKLGELRSNTIELLRDATIVESIHAVVAALLAHRELSGKQVRALMDQAFAKSGASQSVTCPHCRDSRSFYESWEDSNW